jgi:hypothetical protein
MEKWGEAIRAFHFFEKAVRMQIVRITLIIWALLCPLFLSSCASSESAELGGQANSSSIQAYQDISQQNVDAMTYRNQ